MTDLFKSALGYLGTNGSSDDFVGQSIQVSGIKLKIKRLIAEGGFAYVYVAQDLSNGKVYALKRLLATDAKARALIEKEILLSKKLSGHPSIVDFVAEEKIESTSTSHGKTEYLLLSELCTGGSLIDALRLLEGSTMSLEQVCQIVYQTAKAVQHLQSQSPPILHRDLKAENLLFSSSGHVKLCDFGSATTDFVYIQDTWSAHQRDMVEDEMCSFTTPMYRAPEMLDTWSNYSITGQADIWALGCIAYYLCYLKHPFEDSAKLRIVNGNYSIPPKDGRYECLHSLIRGMLTVDPSRRMNVHSVLERLASIAESKGFDMKGPVDVKMEKIDCTSPVHEPHPNGSSVRGPPSHPSPPLPTRGVVVPPLPPQQQSGGLFSSFKGYSGSLLKNIKDTSSKVISTVSQTMNKTDLDVTYLTSRMVAMSFPAEGIESAYRNHIEDVIAVLDGRHAAHYTVYNVSGRHYHHQYPGGQLVQANWDTKRCPSLSELYSTSLSMVSYVQQHPSNTLVLHCMDGKGNTALISACLLVLCGVFTSPQMALNMFAIRRAPPTLSPSHHRYLNYMQQLTEGYTPHSKPLTLLSLTVKPVPSFTQRKDGIRPFVEIWQGEHRALTTLVDYENIRVHLNTETDVTIPLSIHVTGDISICVFHARRVVGKLTAVKVAQVQLHTGFLKDSDTVLTFPLNALDDVTDVERYATDFSLIIKVKLASSAPPQSSSAPWSQKIDTQPSLLFSNPIEMEEVIEKFGSVSPGAGKKIPPRPPAPQTKKEDTEPEKKTATPPAPARPPRRPPAPKEMDFLNLSSEGGATPEDDIPVEVEVAAEGVSLLDIGGEATTETVNNNLSNYDLLSGFGNDRSDSSQQPKEENFFDPMNSNDSNDLFGNFVSPPTEKSNNGTSTDNMAFADLLSSGSNPMNGTKTSPPENKASLDPFADLMGGGWMGGATSKSNTPLGSGSNSPMLSGSPMHSQMWGNQPMKPSANQNTGFGSQPTFKPPLGGGPTMTGNSPFMGGGSPLLSGCTTVRGGSPLIGGSSPLLGGASAMGGASTMGGTPLIGAGANVGGSPLMGGSPSFPRPPNQQASKPSPNYGRSNFDKLSGTNGTTSAPPPKSSAATFDDLLGSQGFTFNSTKESSGPKTMMAMKQEELFKSMDPQKRKLEEWKAGKEHNIRALLCSLNTVLWEDAKWRGCGMHQLVHYDDVKKMYRRACLAVHPDKLVGTEQESLAKMIFMELNDAYTEFENDPAQQIFKK